MSFQLSQEFPENMQDIIRSAVNIVNDDFDYGKFMQAFSNSDPWCTNNKNIPSLSPQVSRNLAPMESDPLKSCPPFRQPVFTFDEACITSQEPRYSYNIKPEYGGSSEKVNPMTNEESVRKAVTDMVYKNGVNMSAPILKLQITGNSNYELDESDLLNIFSRYGNVQRIEVGRFRTAYIVYDTIINALVAQKLLHSQYMKHLDIKLYLSLVNNIDEDILRPEEQQRVPSSNTIYATNEYPSMSGNTPKSQASNISGSTLPSFPYNPTKHTCKYEIQIDNDKDFKIARKIIGPKGCNMKKIIEICQYHLKRSDIIFQSDFLKLRLRGRGSGFKEGPEQRESDDPLHLCVSSKYPEVYNLACKLVEDLLSGLYKEYGVFRQKAGRPLYEAVQIKRIEIYNGSNEKKNPEELRLSTPKSSQNSNDLLNLGQNFVKALNLNGYSGPESSNNSVSTLSDRETTNSPPKSIVQLDEPDFKSP